MNYYNNNTNYFTEFILGTHLQNKVRYIFNLLYIIVTGDYILPKSTTVLIPQFITHRLEKYYPNPTVFDPDNFLPEKIRQRHYYAYIPFSAGPRYLIVNNIL